MPIPKSQSTKQLTQPASQTKRRTLGNATPVQSKAEENAAKSRSDERTDVAHDVVAQSDIKKSTRITDPVITPETKKSGDNDAILPVLSESQYKSPRLLEAERALNSAVTRLEEAMGKDKREEIDFQQIRGVHDINRMAQQLGSTITNYMDQREYLKVNRTEVKVFVETWFKRSIPFVKQSLKVSQVRISQELFMTNYPRMSFRLLMG